jgi:hypothetical protein
VVAEPGSRCCEGKNHKAFPSLTFSTERHIITTSGMCELLKRNTFLQRW